MKKNVCKQWFFKIEITFKITGSGIKMYLKFYFTGILARQYLCIVNILPDWRWKGVNVAIINLVNCQSDPLFKILHNVLIGDLWSLEYSKWNIYYLQQFEKNRIFLVAFFIKSKPILILNICKYEYLLLSLIIYWNQKKKYGILN